MSGFSFSHLSGPEVLDGYAKAKTVNRASDALLLAYLAEIDGRKLFVDAGYPSMHAFVVAEFDLTHEVAKKRIRIARAAHEHPQVLPMLASGRLSLSSFILLIPHINHSNIDELLASASGNTRLELERVLAARFPTSEFMSWTMGANSTTTPEQKCETLGSPGTLEVNLEATHQGSSYPSSLQTAPVAQQMPVASPQTRVTPIASRASGVQFMMEDEAQDDYDYLRTVLGHEAPTPARLFALALKVLRREVDRRKFSVTDHPKKPRKANHIDPRYIPAHIRRIVWKRDQHRCTFVSANGKRCDARSGLELDHIIPVARGGEASVENLRVLCRAHNQHAADQSLGAQFMNGKREAAQRERRAS